MSAPRTWGLYDATGDWIATLVADDETLQRNLPAGAQAFPDVTFPTAWRVEGGELVPITN
jgi:hypothetical protein